jgi:hypothetical protein
MRSQKPDPLAAKSLHAPPRRAIRPFVRAYQENGYGRKALELSASVRGVRMFPRSRSRERSMGW